MGCVGFGGPPAHVALLRELCVDKRGWLTREQFEEANAATQLLPGPASTQMAIFCARAVGGPVGGLLGGLCFIVPGLILILALSALFVVGAPPDWIRGAGLGAGAAVPAVALRAGLDLLAPAVGKARIRWFAYALAGAISAAALGPLVVVVLLACGLVEVAWRGDTRPLRSQALPLLAALGGLGSLAWTALKVGALSYGGGFVIIPLMRDDAVERNGWMTGEQFLNAVALGQITPGPVVHTVAAVGYAASGLSGALLAAVVAFSPSFLFVLAGGPYFDRLRSQPTIRSFLDGAGPSAAGAIVGVAVPLAVGLQELWQVGLLAAATLALLVLRQGVVRTLLAAAALGALTVLAGGSLPGGS